MNNNKIQNMHNVIGTIDWTPKLCWQRDSLSQRMSMGCIIKTNTYFKSAFWRENGQNGMSFTSGDLSFNTKNNDENPVVATFDDCKPDINNPYPSLMGFILSDKARNVTHLYTKEHRKQLVLKQYYKLFGHDQRCFDECIGYCEKIWHNEQFSGGCYVGLCQNNILSQRCYDNVINFKVLNKKHSERNIEIFEEMIKNKGIKKGVLDMDKIKYVECPNEGKRIYFGGTEMASSWQGYMDGAIQAGERAANKVGNLLFDDLNQYLKESGSHGINVIDLKAFYGEMAETNQFAFENDEKVIDQFGIPVKPQEQTFVEAKILPSVRQLFVVVIVLIACLCWFVFL